MRSDLDVFFSEEQIALRQRVREFVQAKITPFALSWEWREPAEARVPWEIVEELSRMGIRTIAAPKRYGGGGAGPLTLCMLAEELARGDMGVAVIFDQTWKITRIFLEWANEQQQEWFFQRFMPNPRAVLAICYTEPEIGSDYIVPYAEARFATTAVWDGSAWVLNGKKRFISNGADADVYLVHASTNPAKGIREGTSRFIVPADTPGLKRTRIYEKMGQRTINNGEVVFENVRLPAWALLGEQDKAMSGYVLKESAIEAAATVLGSAQGAFDHALSWVKARVQGGRPLIEHANVKVTLARLLGKLEAARSLVYRAAWHAENDGDAYDWKWGGLAKTVAAELAVEVAVEAMELQGGFGYMLDSPAQKYVRDCLSFLHSDGTQDAHRLRIGDLLARESVSTFRKRG